MVAAARAMLADDEIADDSFAEAIERLERANVGLHCARVRLSYGEWLRRMNRRLDARQQLNTAYEVFTRIGAQGFAETGEARAGRHRREGAQAAGRRPATS